MKTPTQEAMQWVWEQRQSTNSKDAISALDAVYQHLQKVTLEKEKEVMCQFADEFAIECINFHHEKTMSQEQFFNLTFNTEEK